MEYSLEKLGHGRFQKMCQALVMEEYANVECFPVGVPDGGRDVLARPTGQDGNEFIVFQVKFTEYPGRINDAAKWLEGTISKEASKIKDLIERGAKKYILITNVEGSANLNIGERDRIKDFCNESLDLPFECWWRSEVERRIDISDNIKWSYPSIMSGKDVVKELIIKRAKNNGLKHDTTLRSYLSNRYSNNKNIRFKQVDLKGKISRLYIDIPVYLEDEGSGNQDTEKVLGGIRSKYKLSNAYRSSYRYNLSDEKGLGAAELLINKKLNSELNKVVIEGAPGQGKSTVVQYICQMMRSRVLNKEERGIFQKNHSEFKTRLPFKIELRDYAKWLGKENPFPTGFNFDKWNPSVESFLCEQISYWSGGARFTVDDLHATMRVSPILLVFDGLDEVADIDIRREVVSRVRDAVERVEAISNDIQSIVTSRPAAFTNSPGMSRNDFTYLHLGSVSKSLIDSYSNKWVNAKGLDEKEKRSVKSVISRKLEEPHIRELAQNPMQLTILLNLIYMRGPSLPNNRTALYDKYIEYFLNRESQKSEVIRENRKLIYELHCYLAWILHSEAETGRSSGKLTESEMKDFINKYLDIKGYKEDIVDDLFHGMVERVVALVSRVEGTYEFEVQPLREFFTAKYLYETTPYSPSWNPKPGTIPERFAAISRNFYWLNVTRFFAGCLNRGELPALKHGLKKLATDPDFSLISYPRRLMVKLLSDRVFEQSPKVRDELVDILTETEGFLCLIKSSGGRFLGSSGNIELPSGEGRNKVVNKCFSILDDRPNRDVALSILDVISENTDKEERKNLWMSSVKTKTGYSKSVWLNYGYILNILPELNVKELKGIINDNDNNKDTRNVLFMSDKHEYLSSSEEWFSSVVGDILSFKNRSFPKSMDGSLDLVSAVHDPNRYSSLLSQEGDASALMFFEAAPKARRFMPLPEPSEVELPEYNDLTDFSSAYEVIYDNFERSLNEWNSLVDPWNNVLEALRSAFGTHISHIGLAALSGGITSNTETCTAASDLFDHSLPLSSRARYARLRAGNPKWWSSTLCRAESDKQKVLSILVLLCWASGNTILSTLDELQEVTDSLSSEAWNSLYTLTSSISRLIDGSVSGSRDFDQRKAVVKLSSKKVAALLSISLGESNQIYQEILKGYRGKDKIIMKVVQNQAMKCMLMDNNEWNDEIDDISYTYQEGVDNSPYSKRYFLHKIKTTSIPFDLAKRVVGNHERYPSSLMSVMESIVKENTGASVKSVRKRSEEEGWFDDMEF
jgi:hypothetical protein